MNRSTISDQTFAPARAAQAPSLGRANSVAPPAATGTAAAATAPLLLLLFVLSILPPVYFFVGDTRLNPSRLLLLILSIPLAIRLFSGAAGRIRAIDILMFMFSGWMVIVLLYHEGLTRIPLAGSTVMELLGGYLVGRTLVRNETDYRLFLRYAFISMLVLLPFAVLEFLTNRNLLQDFFGSVFHTFEKSPRHTWRNGFARVMTGFEHPILFGLFCAILVSPVFYLYKRTPVKALCFAALPFGMTYMSLSSGPLIAAGLCLPLILWDYVTGGRWKPLIWLSVAAFIFISIASNRGPVIILIDNLTFDRHTAWTRIWTYTYGSLEVMRHPFGMGMFGSEWERPSWLTDSVDNFWLVIAMRYGFPGILLLGLTLASGIWAIIRTEGLSETHATWRTGYVIALTGLYLALATVHIWSETSSFIMCFIGAGMWFSNAGTPERNQDPPPGNAQPTHPMMPQAASEPDLAPVGSTRRLPTTRFNHTHSRTETSGNSTKATPSARTHHR